jgi:hypothetical protein
LQLLVPLVTTFVTYLIMAYGLPSNTINSIVAPLALVWLLSYFVSCMFSEIFGMTIDTILCCFIADEEMFPADQRFADGSLSTAVATATQAKPIHARVVAVGADDEGGAGSK